MFCHACLLACHILCVLNTDQNPQHRLHKDSWSNIYKSWTTVIIVLGISLHLPPGTQAFQCLTMSLLPQGIRRNWFLLPSMLSLPLSLSIPQLCLINSDLIFRSELNHIKVILWNLTKLVFFQSLHNTMCFIHHMF